jgi:hypothetical protein
MGSSVLFDRTKLSTALLIDIVTKAANRLVPSKTEVQIASVHTVLSHTQHYDQLQQSRCARALPPDSQLQFEQCEHLQRVGHIMQTP